VPGQKRKPGLALPGLRRRVFDGRGMSERFVPFGPAHLAAILLAFLVPVGLSWFTRRAADPLRFAAAMRRGFAALLIGTWIIWFWLLVERHWLAPGNLIPMHLCDWAAIITIVTLIRPNQKSYELAYFWSLGGTLQALLTPDLRYGFPDWRFLVFFLFHSGIIAAVLYLTLGMRHRPWPSSLPRVMAWSLVYLASALLVNAVFRTNFGYLSAKPAIPSLLDLLSPWPWYIGELVLLGLVSILVCYAPFYVWDRFRARRHSA
jgi:hypothetical integral membrane protein (TIGR02206 family)